MEGKRYHYSVLFTGLFLCLLHSGGASSSCGNINPIDFAEITYDEPEGLASHPDGTVASIECGVFYQIVPTNFERTTCTNGSWTGPLPRCRHIPRYCQRHEALVENYGRDCQTPCRQRPNGGCPANKRCHCDGVCGWSCISIYEDLFCPEVANQAGLLVTYDPPERRFNGYANFSCGNGYIYHSGSSRLRCMSNRQWGGGNEFLCIPNVVCGDPPSAEHASLQPSGKQYFLPNDTRSYTCNLGYISRGNRDITCDDNYEWSAPEFTCRPRPCTYPGRIPNADLTTQLFQFKERAIYVCREGYENPPYTLPYRTCQANGQWTQILPICEPIQCPAILDIANGNVDSRGNDFDSQIYFTCNDGYRLDGAARRVCQGDKTWSGQETVCTEIICEDPGVPVNGYKTNAKQVYHLDDVVYYHCNEGYTMDGSILNSCTESGEWRYPVPVCGGPCIAPPYPRDGWWQNGNDYPPGTSVPHNTRLQLRCNRRFNERRSRVTCNDGVWSDSDQVHRLCRGTPCEVRWSSDVALNITYDPPVSDEDRSSHPIPHDTKVHYGCAWGYRLQGVTETRCNQGRYNNNNIPGCKLVPCLAEDVSHGRLIYTTPDEVNKHDNPLHGDTRRLRCGSGYSSRNFSRSRCDNGAWVEGSDDIRCYPKPCDPIPDTKGLVNYTRIAQGNGMYSHGTEVTVNCDSGYLPAYGNGTAVCNASQWLTVIPTCTRSRNLILDSHVSQTPPKKNRAVIGNAWLARDGNTYSAPQYCSRTKVTDNPWWKADMKNIYNFTHVKIYNRLDREEHRYDLVGAEIRVGLNEDYTTNLLCGEPVTRRQIESSTEANHGILIRCVGEGINGIIGNVISVHIPTINNQKRELSLCEIEVYQQGLSISVNGAKNGTRVGCVVPHVENADVSSTNVATQQVLLEGEDVRISCHARHDLRGSDPSHVDLTCLGNSSWDKDKPVCEPRTCTVDPLNNGGFPNGTLLYNHGENITFTCNPGYEKEDDVYRCDRGIAVPRNPRCIQASCNAPDLLDHMVTAQLQSHFPHGTLLNISCEDGFQLSTNQEQLRCHEGAWSPPLTATCQRVPCGPPVRATHSTIETLTWEQGYVHGTRVRYSCSEGWEIEGITERECVNGQWTGSTPTCRVAAPPRCMLPDRSSGHRYSIIGFIGNIFDEGLPIGERVSISVSCNHGYRAQPSVQTECLERGVWSVAVPICDRMERLCSKPGYLSHVVQYVNGLETNKLATYPHDEFPEGTFLVSRCSLPGQYVLRGSAIRTCSDSSWTGEEPSCVDADTRISFQNNQPLDVRSDGTIVIHPRSQLYISCRVPSYSTARFESENGPGAEYWAGYPISTMVMDLNPPHTSHSGWFTCRSNDNTLSHSVYVQFAEIYCDSPTTPTNGEFQDFDYGWEYGRYYMGKEITFACNDGYILDGERRMTCVLGEWSHPVPRCQRTIATCEELHPPTHGTKIGGNRIGDSVFIGCNQGYQLQGEPFLDCQESGEWSHPLPSCVEIVEPERPCDSVSCEVWQKCETDSSGVGVCRCISPHSCPVTNETVVCGTDGRNYTNFCRLKALACIRNTGVEVASRTWFCIKGVPEHVPSPTPFIEIEEPSQLSSFDTESPYEESPPTEPAVREPITLPPNEGPSSRSYSFCDVGVCPSSSAAELSQDATAIVIAYTDNWDADLGILRIQIYEVMAGELPSWTEGSNQDVLIDVGAASERGCLCPSFQATDPVIIRFSQNLTQDGKGQLLHTDIVLPYSTDLYQEIRLLLEEPVHVQTPPPPPPPQDESSDSFSSLIGSHDGPEGQSWFPSDPDVITTTDRTNTESVDSPLSVESSYLV